MSEEFKELTEAERQAIYGDAISEYGMTSQMIVAIEEMSELIKELTKAYRGTLNMYHVTEEIADVEIMLEQLKMIYRNDDLVKIAKNSKVLRLKKRLEEQDG